MNISPVSSASAGMDAARLRMDNAANNVANVNTRGQIADQASTAGQAQQTQSVAQTQPPADTYEPGTVAAGASQSVERDVTNMVAERNAYDANAATVRAQNETAGTTIDLVG